MNISIHLQIYIYFFFAVGSSFKTTAFPHFPTSHQVHWQATAFWQFLCAEPAWNSLFPEKYKGKLITYRILIYSFLYKIFMHNQPHIFHFFITDSCICNWDFILPCSQQSISLICLQLLLQLPSG